MVEEADLATIIHAKEDWPDYLVEGDKVLGVLSAGFAGNDRESSFTVLRMD